MSARLAAIHALLLCLAAAPALAAPPERAVDAEGVRTCPRMGPGFVEIPGTTSCIRIGGRVVAEAGVASRSRLAPAGPGRSGFGSHADILFEHRTDTELGPFRAVWKVRVGPNGELR
jgi:hypothetical protein